MISSCGADFDAALALYRDYVRPRLLAARRDPEVADIALPGEQPSAEQVAMHALFRVVGRAGRPSRALSLVR